MLLLTEHGWNLSVINRLKVPQAAPDAGSNGPRIYRVELEKHKRGAGRYFETRNLTDDEAASPGRLITQALEATVFARAAVHTLSPSTDRFLIWRCAKAPLNDLPQDETVEMVVRLFWKQGVAATGVQDIVNATGLNRSSLYSTYGGKQQLYLAALNRYVAARSQPVFRQLAEDGRGLPAVADFFRGLISARTSGEHARWGCLVSNAHAGAESDDLEVRAVLDRHHQGLCDALHSALETARQDGQLAAAVDPASAAELLSLLAYGVNVRSRAGGDARSLSRTVDAALDSLRPPG